jgi:hypothetical protein
MLRQQRLHVVFKFELRVHQCPVMRRTNERQESNEQLEFFPTEGDPQGPLGPTGPRRLQEEHGGGGQQVLVV